MANKILQFNNNHSAIVLGLPETGLAIGRSLGKKQISVIGISHTKEIGYYSKYIDGKILPHPFKQEKEFIKELKSICSVLKLKPILFIASDEYLQFYIRNEMFVNEYFLTTLPPAKLIENIQDKYAQYKLAQDANIDTPKTFFIEEKKDDVEQIAKSINYPVLIKARDVNIWRKKVSGRKKAFVIENKEKLQEKLTELKTRKVPVIVQEIVQSTDRNNFKVCVFINKEGKYQLIFLLKKIHQYPIHFGIASTAISIKNEQLYDIGKKLFSSIGYTGVGSAEFKFDNRDKKYKLIEINSRYWQQNALADYCGMNFPLMDFLEATDQNPGPINSYKLGLKWVNLVLSYRSYHQYRKLSEINFRTWFNDIKGKKVISFCTIDDIRLSLIYWYRQFLRIVISAIKKQN